jgi:hypothetical protein
MILMLAQEMFRTWNRSNVCVISKLTTKRVFPTLAEAQAFDGPAPETINGRAAMLGVVAGMTQSSTCCR